MKKKAQNTLLVGLQRDYEEYINLICLQSRHWIRLGVAENEMLRNAKVRKWLIRVEKLVNKEFNRSFRAAIKDACRVPK